MASANIPAACHTPRGRSAPYVSPEIIWTCITSPASQGHTRTLDVVADNWSNSPDVPCASLPLRERSASASAPLCASQRPVSSPRPAVPPVMTCVSHTKAALGSVLCEMGCKRGTRCFSPMITTCLLYTSPSPRDAHES
eukprot:6146633-Prymnesium_polylepis.2